VPSVERPEPGAATRISRFLLSAGLTVQARVAAIAQSLVNRYSRSSAAGLNRISSVNACSFSEIPAYKAILKHRGVAKVFGLADPFYKCHDARLGAYIWIGDRCYTNYASYDYLGLNQHPSVKEAAKAAIARHGTSVSASRIVAGERPFHRELETVVADLYGAEDAVTFVSGHATNVSTLATVLSSDDLVLHDELVHNSVLIGAKLSQATVRPFRHNDINALEKLLEQNRRRHKQALITVEGLYSMDGDVPNLPRLIELKERYGAWLMVDEAHALGVLGSRGHGSAEHFGIPPACVDIWMGTLSKALASCGGYVAGKKELIDLLRFQAPGLVYSVGLAPPLAAAASAALQALKNEPERVARVQTNGRLFLAEATSAGLNTGTSQGHAIVSVIVGDLVNAGRLTERMLARGVNVLPIIFPAVPIKAARLRFFITSEHTPAQIRDAVRLLREELEGLRLGRRAA
jgi:8-amino-7-oxononanoate synthase